MHRRVLDGERGSTRHPHRRFDRRRPGPDPDRRSPPTPAERGPRDHPGPGRGGRLQRPVRALAGLDRLRGDRGEPAGQPIFGARLEGHGLPDRPGRRPDRHRSPARRDPERRDRDDGGRVRAGPRLRRREAAALPVRQVPDRRPEPGQPDEGDRRGHGDRPHVRGGAEQGAPGPGAGRRRAAGRGSGVAADDRLPGGRAGRGSGRPGRRGRRPRDPDRLARRRRADVRVDPAGRAERRADRPAPVPRPIRFAPVADPRPAPARCPGARRGNGDRHRLVVRRGDGPQRRARSGRRGGRCPDRRGGGHRRHGPPRHGQAGRLRRPRAGRSRRRPDRRHPDGAGRDGPRGRLRDGRHVRGGVRGRDAVFLRDLCRVRLGPGGAARPPAGRPRHRLGTGPDRPGHRVRLLRGPGRRHAPQARLERGHDQLQPGDRVDRLRRLDPAVLRAARSRERAQRHRCRVAGRHGTAGHG